MASICLLAFRLHNNMRGLECLTLIVIVSKLKTVQETISINIHHMKERGESSVTNFLLFQALL